MATEPKGRTSKPQLVIDHLTSYGRISQGSSVMEMGLFRLADAVYKLRTSHRHLVPAHKKIITIKKRDAQGEQYGEYHLVDA